MRSNQLSYPAKGAHRMRAAPEPPVGIEPTTFSLPWKRSAD
ncbi:hypothetical protein BN11_310021 [Nostocoides australiense Ben110]|uniref:Uncharacterized protein n=1 Tax=Nostocoides australiense Ben110 TaxID=1193182 RepID=W6JX34_9MICO|nr:hypothetical protein BN11_310021 [Tetrasphaera australiensis Ben110]